MNFYFHADKGDTDFKTFNEEVVRKLRELASILQSEAKTAEERGVEAYEMCLKPEDFDRDIDKRMAQSILDQGMEYNFFSCDECGEVKIPCIDNKTASWLFTHIKKLAQEGEEND